jgi:hypothetical protein
MACNDKLLVFYNESNELFYIKISDINQTGKKWESIMCPIISTDTPVSSGTTQPPQYDTFTNITLSDSYIFAVSVNSILERPDGSMYYCKLDTDGTPTMTNSSYWNVVDKDINYVDLKLMKANSNTLFIVQSEQPSETQTALSNKIHYFPINNTNTVLGTMNTMLLNDNPIIDDIAVNNDVIWITDNNISNNNNTLQLFWSILENSTFKADPNWQSINSPHGNSIIDMTIFNNNLLILGGNLYYIELYDPSITTQATTTRPITSGTTQPNTTGITTTTISGTTQANTTGITTTTSGTTKPITSGTTTTGPINNPSSTSRVDFLLGLSESNPGDKSTTTKPNELSSMLPSGVSVNDVLNGLSNNIITPENNLNNINDFLANNTMFGNNLYISPMNNFPGPTGNQSSLVAGLNVNPDQIQVQNGTTKRKISSMFFPMVKMI